MGKNIVGFDFGESRMKMVLYDGEKIRKSVSVDVPDNMVADGVILSANAMAEFIAITAGNNGIAKGNAAIILSSAYVYSKIISMPVMTHQQVLYNLPYEFSDYLTEEKGSYYFDYMILGTEIDEEGNISEMRVFACTVLKSVINEYRSMLRMAGFKLKAAVPVEYAYSRLIRQYISQRGIRENDDYCIVDIGHTETRVFIFHGSEYVQRRNIELGMKSLSRIISNQLGVDMHVAEAYKRSDFNGVLETEYCMDFYDSLAVEIMKTVNFFNYTNREAVLDKLYLLGGGAEISYIAERIAEMTGLIIDSASNFLLGTGRFDNKDLFTIACGSVL